MFLVTFGFLVFMAATIAAYYLVPGKIQWIVLLIASMVFYMLAGTPYTIIYLFITIFTIWAGSNYIDKIREDAKKSKRVLLVCIVVTAGLLAALKYTNFFISNFKSVCGIFGKGQDIQLVSWAASLGVSFYTLQALSYLLDVYWGTSKPQKNLFKVALFTSYFPQMSSGPISRYHQLENQLYAPHKFDYKRLCFGLQRMLFGFVKKLVVAENLGMYTGFIFDDSANYNGMFLWMGLFAYVVQLYADFSGCMDIVLGASQCFGIYMPENFNRPFHSRSLQEFWKRWHITLGLWAQDYVMYPVLRSRAWNKMRKKLKKKFGKAAAKNVPTYLAMLVLWFYMGLWHGGAWHYVAEGIWFGAVIMSGQLFDRQLKQVMKILHINPEARWWHGFQSVRTAVNYSIGVFFFRASSVRQALHYIKSSISPKCLALGNFSAQAKVFLNSFTREQGLRSLVCLAVGVTIMLVLFAFQAKEKSIYEWLAKRNIVIRWGILYLIIFAVILFGVYGPEYNAADFIYGGF